MAGTAPDASQVPNPPAVLRLFGRVGTADACQRVAHADKVQLGAVCHCSMLFYRPAAADAGWTFGCCMPCHCCRLALCTLACLCVKQRRYTIPPAVAACVLSAAAVAASAASAAAVSRASLVGWVVLQQGCGALRLCWPLQGIPHSLQQWAQGRYAAVAAPPRPVAGSRAWKGGGGQAAGCNSSCSKQTPSPA